LVVLVMEPDRARGVPTPADGAAGRVDVEPVPEPPPRAEPEREQVPRAGSRRS
jgi:hypothetical protein